jgi:predicted transposase/invertase (TIGR01784 family)
MELEQTTTVPEIGKTIVVLRRLSADEKIQQEAWYREKQLHDEANAINGSRREGLVEGRAEGNLEAIVRYVKRGRLSLEEAAEDAGMTVEDFEKFMEQNS